MDSSGDENSKPNTLTFSSETEDIFSDLAFLNVEQSGSLDDQIDHWLRAPPAEPIGQESLLSGNTESSELLENDMSLSGLAFDSLNPNILHLPSAPVDTGDYPATATSSMGEGTSQSSIQTGKLGARFTQDTVKILRKWFLTHGHHPFPDENEKKILQQQTNLSKSQIMNWFANARRRDKISRSRDDLPCPTKAMDMPRRPDTPAPRRATDSMNPLERWVESPPENEPASAVDIARAIASSPPASSSDSSQTWGFSRSTDGSSGSRGSRSSADSHGSRSIEGLYDPLVNIRSRRRRRKRATKQGNRRTVLMNHAKKFPCTFCTQSFARKYDWQRHENSVHLPLERWICCPEGPLMNNPTNHDILCCVFCGLADPDDSHIESHHYTACQKRTVPERSFNRKDHLRQHLRMFHQNASFIEWSMMSWRIKVPAIRSRCGFCGHQMADWEARVDHISDHFKMGKSMADWQGDWGFDPEIAEIIENGMPPYLIEFERSTPLPFEGEKTLAATPCSAYELLKLELSYFMQRFYEGKSCIPSTKDMQLEGCRIILASETMSQSSHLPVSWLRDLIFSDPKVSQDARFSPIRTATESRFYPIEVKGKNTLFESCPFEKQLLDTVSSKLSITPSYYLNDQEIRQQSCLIIGQMEDVSITPSEFIATWLINLIHSEDSWISLFRQRANIPRSPEHECNEATTNDFQASIHDYSRVDQALVTYLEQQRHLGIEPSNDDLRNQARIAVNQSHDRWFQTTADNDLWLHSFRKRYPPMPNEDISLTSAQNATTNYTPTTNTATTLNAISGPNKSRHIPLSSADHETLLNARSLVSGATLFAANDWNFYHWLEDDLRRWAISTMSPHNPAQHIPSDEEFQHHARMATYNEDDPFNQTIADNPIWLGMLKKSLNI
ncbi:hypothetical protein IWW34DRAFT_729659 [Fusarium oxysporum f. sp. albedinis]|nr:hypothetical protein IWW34DRAFT_729659 [Fusarium oxysporum f. sp. albedinis]KAJ0150459.1 Uncharacterized protein HZ326_6981 [Fusarium oxysporum f. sp. albedinis]KAK2484457.1 hypothetical protein H9L39_02437 [Fusarium oxysporum f. sp. albedinis]